MPAPPYYIGMVHLWYGKCSCYPQGNIQAEKPLTLIRKEVVMSHSIQKTLCPYCGSSTSVKLPDNYAPRFVHCDLCQKKFIVERRTHGFQSMSVEEAPCISNPDCRAIESGAADEQ